MKQDELSQFKKLVSNHYFHFNSRT